jgi:putative transcriptional regulator
MDGPSLTGRLLVAAPALGDPNFDRTVVLLLQHSDEGAFGIVLNRPTDTEVGEALPEWRSRASDPPVVFVGGPVQRDGVLGLGERRHDPTGLRPVGEDDFVAVGRVGPVDLNRPEDDRFDRVRLFAGYAGWSAGQLEGEIEADAWFVVSARPDDAFATAPERLWSDVLRRQPGELRLLANYPLDPRNN